MNKKELVAYISPECISYRVVTDNVCAGSPVTLPGGGLHPGEDWDGED